MTKEKDTTKNEKTVLISFLGTGVKYSQYGSFIYEIDGNPISENEISLFIRALSLYNKDKYDKIIILGTLTSMWENVYRSFDGCENDELDTELTSLIFDNNYMSEIDTMPNCLGLLQKYVAEKTQSEVIIELLRFGCNNEQIKENAQIIMGIDRFFDDPNTKYNIIVDITHGFRSLPLYVMNLLIYLQNVKSNIEIKHIYYAMSEMTNDDLWKNGNKKKGIAKKGDKRCPVVDLNDPEYGIMALNKWINGAYAFKEFGKGYQISKLLNRPEEKDSVNKINDFSDVMNLNSMSNIDTKTELLLSIQDKDINPFANQVLKPVISQFSIKNNEGKFVNKFKGNNPKSLLALTEWHFEHKNYASAYLTILQCLTTYIREKCNFDKYIFPKDKYSEEYKSKIDGSWNKTIQFIKDTKGLKVYSDKNEYINELYQEYADSQKDKCAKQVLGNEEIRIIKDDLSSYTQDIGDISLVYKSVNLIRNSIAHVNNYNSKSLNYKLKQLQDKLPGVSIIETNLIEIKILDASIKLLKKTMK